jgi:hypothetical protein
VLEIGVSAIPIAVAADVDERDGAQPPGALLAKLARTLEVSADELLGLKPGKETTSRKQARLRKRLRKVEQLPPADQRTVLKFVDALHTARRNGQ